MKQSLACPKCRHRKLWVLSSVDVARQVDVPLDADLMKMASKLGKAVFTTARKEENARGFEAYVCAQCGYTETYATSFEHVAKHGKLVDGDAEPDR